MGQCQRGNASVCVLCVCTMCVCVTLATVANSHQSEQRALKHLHQDLRHLVWLFGDIWQPFRHLRNSESISSCFFSLLPGFFCGYVRIYDGELKWWGRKSCWCLSKYYSRVHLLCVDSLTWIQFFLQHQLSHCNNAITLQPETLKVSTALCFYIWYV